MRILDADILAYALYDESPAYTHAWQLVEKGLRGDLDLCLTPTTILETYNTLFWFYRVRPMKSLLEKLSLTVERLKVIETSMNGLKISAAENIPLGDGFLIATAVQHNKPVIVTNDRHLIGKAPKYGLIVENPVPEDVRRELSEWNAE